MYYILTKSNITILYSVYLFFHLLTLIEFFKHKRKINTVQFPKVELGNNYNHTAIN